MAKSIQNMIRVVSSREARANGAGQSCSPITIIPHIKISPLHFAREIEQILEEINEQEYGPDDLTAEQVRLLGLLKDTLRKFSEGFAREEEEAIKKRES